MWDEIAYPFLNFSSAAAEVWELINNLLPCLTVHVLLIHAGIKVNPY